MRATNNQNAARDAQIDLILRAAADDDHLLPEPPPDLVTRALRHASTSSARRVPGHVWGFVGLSGVAACAAVAVAMSLPSSQLALANRGVGKTTVAIASHEPVGLPPEINRPVTTPHTMPPALSLKHRRVIARVAPHRRHHPVEMRPKLPLVQLAQIDPPPATSPPESPRPFWHDEQVECDDYTAYAPAMVAEGTGDAVTSVTPAIVEVSYSTTHPIGAVLPADLEIDR